MAAVVLRMVPADRAPEKWPEPDDTLYEREGWERQTITLTTKTGGEREIEAAVLGELAVHRMITYAGLDPGWAISSRVNGLRMHSGGRVWASSRGAMLAAETFALIYSDWTGWLDGKANPLPAIHAVCNRYYDDAEKRGDILRDIVT